jgi:small subunit ribosomal protein S5
MGLIDNSWSQEKIDKFTAEKFTRYSPEEMEVLREQLSSEQLESLQAGEAAVDPQDLTVQGALRTDPYRMPYIDDFRDIQPIIDRRPRTQPPPDPMARFMNLDEFTQDLVEWSRKFEVGDKRQKLKRLEEFAPPEWQAKPEKQWPENVKREAHDKYTGYLTIEAAKSQEDVNAGGTGSGPTDADILEYVLERSIMTDNNLQSQSFLAPALPRKVPGVAGHYKTSTDELDVEGIYQGLKMKTGMSVKQITSMTLKTVDVNFVSNQTRLGKIPSVRVTMIAGNKEGWLGVGVAKGVDIRAGSQMATLKAIENMQPIRRYEDRTVYGNIKAKISGTVVELYARPPGMTPPSPLSSLPRACGLTKARIRPPHPPSPV